MIGKFIAANQWACAGLEKRWPTVFGAVSFNTVLTDRINRDLVLRRRPDVLEVGGIDRPLLSKDPAFTYTGLDIEEKSNCCDVYDRFLVQSVEEPIPGQWDLVISRTLLEHVPNNRASIRQLFGATRPGGTTHHYVPSKWHPYSIALRLVGPMQQRRLIRLLRRHAVEITGYRAFFDHCCPGAMHRLFEEAGYREIDIRPFYRANDYFAFFVPAYVAVSLFENGCRKIGWSTACSGFIISARRPDTCIAGANAADENKADDPTIHSRLSRSLGNN